MATKQDPVRWLLYAALGALLSGAVFSAAATMIWPSRWPPWVGRVSAAGVLAGTLLTVTGVITWLSRRD